MDGLMRNADSSLQVRTSPRLMQAVELGSPAGRSGRAEELVGHGKVG